MNTINLKNIYAAAEEYNPLVLDTYNRFRYYMSSNNALNPAISNFLVKEGFKPTYKNNKKFAVCISHDVDFLYEKKQPHQFLKSAVKSVKNQQLSLGYYNFLSLLKKTPNPSWALDFFLDFESKNNIVASYYFLALEKGEPDFNYKIETQTEIFKAIKNAGSEIGMHGGHQAYNDINKIANEREKLETTLGEKVVGYRNHYLRFKTPDTWKHLHSLGFKYDTTFGFADMPGFRNGLCYPFRPYDLQTNSFIDILEIPLIVMDVTFFKYLGLTVVDSFRLFEKLYEEVKNCNGVLTVLWHNNCVTDDYLKLYNLVFSKIISDNDAWITTSATLADWWKENNLASMEKILVKHFQNF